MEITKSKSLTSYLFIGALFILWIIQIGFDLLKMKGY